ncbi:MAG: uracil-DNA glycosylase [bacterium]
MKRAEEEIKQRYDSMKAIRDELLSLTASPLYKYRTENNYFPVIGEGDHFAEIMFVGEAPGQNEAKKGRPFCGASGKFLDLMIASIGLLRKDVYITNLVKDRPPENRDPEPAEIELYGPFLNRQIEIIKPKVVIALGRHSMKYLMELFGLENELLPISKIHGKVFTPNKSNKVNIQIDELPKVVCLYHPAVALYNGSMREVLINDFKVISETIGIEKKEKSNNTSDQGDKDDGEQDAPNVVQLELIK